MKQQLRVFALLSAFIITACTWVHGQTWTTVGSPGFTAAGGAIYTSIAIDNSGMPYVAYSDYPIDFEASVMKYNGTSWETVGSRGLTDFEAEFITLRITKSDTPYIAYNNNASPELLKYNGSSWINIDPAYLSVYNMFGISMALDTGSIPYMAVNGYPYSDNFGITVLKYDEGWDTVGNRNFESLSPTDDDALNYNSIDIDRNNTPYVVYVDYTQSNKATVMKYYGSSWVVVGTAGLSGGAVCYPTIAIDTSGTPYLAYQDSSNSNKVTVMKYNGSSWVTVGSAGFSAGAAAFTYIAIAKDNTPYVVYQDAGHSLKATVMKYNGTSWVNAGSAGFSAGEVYYTTMAFNRDGIPYVVYTDGANGDKATVMRLQLPPINGTDSLCIGATTALSDPVSGGTWSNGNAAIATIDTATGIVTAIATGKDTITYTASEIPVTIVITVDSLPVTGIITGTDSVCPGATTILTDTVNGGIWSSSNETAIIESGSAGSGSVTGVYTGVDTLFYVMNNFCGTDTQTYRITVLPLATAGTITGADSVCQGAAILLADAASAGIWSCSNANATNTGGNITGISAGADTISYIVTNSCSADTQAYSITVKPLPNAGTITGTDSLCPAATETLSDMVTGGAWSSTNTNATNTGSIVTAVNAGTDTILYVVTNSCGADTQAYRITINPLPNAGTITGTDSVCPGDTVILSATASGGVWSSSNALAIIESGSAGSGSVVGIAEGIDTIRYAVSSSCGADTAVFPLTVRSIAGCTEEVSRMNSIDGLHMQLSPNPAASEVNVVYTATEKVPTNVSIANVVGETVITQDLGTQESGSTIIPVSKLPAGVYMVTITSGGNKVVKRLVKE